MPDEGYRNRGGQIEDGKRRAGKERYDARYFKHAAKAGGCAGHPYMDKRIRNRSSVKRCRALYMPVSKYKENLCRQMGEKIGKPKYKKLYSRRMRIIEPVFANITYCKGIRRFTLRTKKKAEMQRLLYCMVHNIGKCNMAEKKKGGAA